MSNNTNNGDGKICFPSFMEIISNVERQRKEVKNKYYLYHYTCIDAFISIMQNRDFWVSNIRFMNDAQEFNNGKHICKKEIQKRLNDESSEIRYFFNGLLQICNDDISAGFFKINSNDIFALSFCDDGDILSQWQCYGSEGISIGFCNNISIPESSISFMNEDLYMEEIKKKSSDDADDNTITPHNNIMLFNGDKIIYNDEEKIQIFNQIFDYSVNFIKEYGANVIDLCINETSDALFHYFALMKDSNFSHEHEKRLLYYNKNDNKSIHFRRRGNIILPYVKLKILDANCRPHKFFPISDIFIAPSSRQNYVADSVKYFLSKSGYEYLVDKVKLSKIPYRG